MKKEIKEIVVTMILNEIDIENAEKLFDRFPFQNKADVVSAALSISAALAEYFDEGKEKEFYTLKKDGSPQKITISFGIHSI